MFIYFLFKTTQELATFGRHVIRKFFEKAAENKKLFMEILFWKSKQDLFELEEGYGAVRQSA